MFVKEKNISDAYGRARARELTEFHETMCGVFKVNSPIERIFFLAFTAIVESNHIQNENFLNSSGRLVPIGLRIDPQVSIGPYRVDFVCSYSYDPESDANSVVVECDSQKFHDRTEPERRYEKKRDRYIQKQNFKVFRFTGSELMKNPIGCASEVIEFLTGRAPDISLFEEL